MLLVEWLNFILNICAFDEGLQRLKIDEEWRKSALKKNMDTCVF